VLGRGECDVQERPPFRPLRFPNQRHLRLLREAVTFAGVTRNARANHIFPSRGPAAIPRYHMIKIQIVAIERVPAVLAGVLVALENIVPGKLHFLFRQPIEKEQHDHARHPDLPRNRLNQLVIGRVGGKVAPAFKIVGQEIIRVVRRNHLSMTGVNERKSAAGRADVHRLPETVQHQNLTI